MVEAICPSAREKCSADDNRTAADEVFVVRMDERAWHPASEGCCARGRSGNSITWRGPRRVTGFSQVGIVLDDVVGRRVFSGISLFPRPFISVPFNIQLTLVDSQDLAVKSHPNLFTLHSRTLRTGGKWTKLRTVNLKHLYLCNTCIVVPCFIRHAPGISAPINEDFKIVWPNHLQFTDKGRDKGRVFTFGQQPMRERRWLEYIQYLRGFTNWWRAQERNSSSVSRLSGSPFSWASLAGRSRVDDILTKAVLDGASCTGKRDWGRNGKESAMASVRDPYQHLPGMISGNHAKPKSGWLDRKPNPDPPECESSELPLRYLARYNQLAMSERRSNSLQASDTILKTAHKYAGELSDVAHGIAEGGRMQLVTVLPRATTPPQGSGCGAGQRAHEGGPSSEGGWPCLSVGTATDPTTKANRAQSPAGSLPDFRKWESFRTMTLVGDLPFTLPLHFGFAPFSTHFTLIGSQELVNSHPNLSPQ
ncbi:hypothetical protein PR048_002987 [Dryococelus australis]|uniref:Uncharacterized protein n=1 Tax=Dryococelus australis TaxID=614101 RepID=A0ABQ9IP08_9NEOP|nr:hypothetical protein PR048_002987 [Dryococelus australis]